jgi:hypothetical protein
MWVRPTYKASRVHPTIPGLILLREARTNGKVVGVVHSVYRVDLSHLDSRVLQMVSEPTFATTGVCGSGVRTVGFITHVGPVGCTAWHMCRHLTYDHVC